MSAPIYGTQQRFILPSIQPGSDVVGLQVIPEYDLNNHVSTYTIDNPDAILVRYDRKAVQSSIQYGDVITLMSTFGKSGIGYFDTKFIPSSEISYQYQFDSTEQNVSDFVNGLQGMMVPVQPNTPWLKAMSNQVVATKVRIALYGAYYAYANYAATVYGGKLSSFYPLTVSPTPADSTGDSNWASMSADVLAKFLLDEITALIIKFKDLNPKKIRMVVNKQALVVLTTRYVNPAIQIGATTITIWDYLKQFATVRQSINLEVVQDYQATVTTEPNDVFLYFEAMDFNLQPTTISGHALDTMKIDDIGVFSGEWLMGVYGGGYSPKSQKGRAMITQYAPTNATQGGYGLTILDRVTAVFPAVTDNVTLVTGTIQ